MITNAAGGEQACPPACDDAAGGEQACPPACDDEADAWQLAQLLTHKLEQQVVLAVCSGASLIQRVKQDHDRLLATRLLGVEPERGAQDGLKRLVGVPQLLWRPCPDAGPVRCSVAGRGGG